MNAMTCISESHSSKPALMQWWELISRGIKVSDGGGSGAETKVRVSVCLPDFITEAYMAGVAEPRIRSKKA